MSPPYFLFAPLERHIDSGFGATGEAFLLSAKRLADDPENRTPEGHLPIAYLYRHSIELFLKGAIITVHRSLDIDYGLVASADEPQVLVGAKWRSMYTVHGVADLFAYLKRVLTENAAAIRERARTPWDNVPEEWEHQIAEVHRLDSSSTFFRYPTTKHADDAKKSSFQPVDDLAALAAGPPAITLLMLDQEDRVMDAFSSRGRPMTDALAVLRETADSMNAAQLGLRMELADGW
jgi:hypothetical protein